MISTLLREKKMEIEGVDDRGRNDTTAMQAERVPCSGASGKPGLDGSFGSIILCLSQTNKQ